MFKKAYRYDEDTLFYFDEHNCKYVAKDGSIAWRTNNPGLILSCHPLAKTHNAIGAHDQIAIFPSLKQGMAAFRAWLKIPKYRFSFFEIAKHYQPQDPDEYLEKLCVLANFSKDIQLKKISTREFEKLGKAIQCLNGFFNNQGTLIGLLKITARYYSNNTNVDLYIAGYEEFISKHEAVHRIETHQLDAVIVHKANNNIYLRSRPVHGLNRIHFSHHEFIKESSFKDVIRDAGEQKPGQCIWGYINGINNTSDEAKASIQVISNLANADCVWSLTNDKKLLLSLGNIWDACLQKLNKETEVVKFAVLFFRLLLEISDKDPSHPPVIIFTHSQGAIISSTALQLLTSSERQRLRIFTFGGGSFIFPEASHLETHNYISIGDFVPRLAASTTLALLAIRRYEENKQGFSDDQIIEGLMSEDIENNLSTANPHTLALYRLQRRSYYLSEFNKIAHITVLDEAKQGIWEHSIHIPCYQKKIKEIIDLYKNKNTTLLRSL